MATFRLRRFSNLKILKAVEPTRLLEFLQPYSAYFAVRGIHLPLNTSAGILDYQALIGVFMTPDNATPKELLDALYLVDEMSGTEAGRLHHKS